MHETSDISAILAHARERLLDKANVVATGVGFKVSQGQRTGTLSIVCSVLEKLPLAALSTADVVPPEIDGVPTDVVATGRIRALAGPSSAAHTVRLRPAPGGVSLGHHDITAGTLGCLVRRGDRVFLLSNNHVLANSNAGAPGDAILQPGPIDSGTDPADRIATLEAFVPIVMAEQPSGCALARAAADLANGVARLVGSNARMRVVSTTTVENLVDAAIAAPIDVRDVDVDILGIGPATGVARAGLGEPIVKSGRTTGVTNGTIEQVDVTVDVRYGQQVARFSDQMMAGAVSAGGDSGSVVLDAQHRVVGLLFAGSESTTVINRIEHVFAALDVSL